MKKTAVLSVLVLGLVSALAAIPAFADPVVLYDNGPTTYNISAYTITSPCINQCVSVTDSFTLSSNSTVTGVNFVAWLQDGNSLSNVGWAITSIPAESVSSYIDIMQSFVAANTTQVFIENNNQYWGGYDVYEESFSIPNLSLPAGTYYLTLGNAIATGGTAYWDENDGSSTASNNYCNLSGGGPSNCTPPSFSNQSIGSESFQILGTEDTSPTPEPSSFLLLGSGLAGSAGLIKRKLMA